MQEQYKCVRCSAWSFNYWDCDQCGVKMHTQKGVATSPEQAKIDGADLPRKQRRELERKQRKADKRKETP